MTCSSALSAELSRLAVAERERNVAATTPMAANNSSTGATPTNQCTGNGGTFKGTFKDTYAHSVGIQMNQRF